VAYLEQGACTASAGVDVEQAWMVPGCHVLLVLSLPGPAIEDSDVPPPLVPSWPHT
jgi:hypothetical protein